MYYEYLIKREIFNLSKENNSIDSLHPWVHLYEIFYKQNISGPSFKTYYDYIQSILNDPEFCEESDRGLISDNPNFFLRMEFLLFQSGIKREISGDIMNYIKTRISNGFKFDGKDFRGILAAAYYIHPESRNLGLPQDIESI